MEAKQATGIQMVQQTGNGTAKVMGRNMMTAVGSGLGKATNGLRLVHVGRGVERMEVREATTGRAVPVARIWAVADRVPARAAESQPAAPPKAELAFYRKYTEAMLRRYLRVSVEVGRVPSVMGREMFRGNVSHYKMANFEDGVVFCVDVERCLAKLRNDDQRVIERIALQGYTRQEAAPKLGISFKTCVTKYGEALDRLTAVFLAGRLLEPQKWCQEVETVEKSPSYEE
jgi:predicted DNA-binding protein (UPF0251 family)